MIKPVLRVAAKAVIEVEGKILILHPSEIDPNRNWHIPGGIRDDINEAIIDTATREVQEETGIDLETITARVCKVGEWSAIDKGEPVKILAIFFHFKLTARPPIILSREHDAYAWINTSDHRGYQTNREVRELVEELLT